MGLTNLVLPLIPVNTIVPRDSGQTALMYVQSLLAPGGRFYLVAVAPNKPLEIVAHMRQRGLEAEVGRPFPEVEAGLTEVRSSSSVELGASIFPSFEQSSRETDLAKRNTFRRRSP